MKLFVTIGTTGEAIEHEYDLPDGVYATYIGLELEREEVDPDIPGTGRMTILRTPFYMHGEGPIHTICSRYSDVIEQYPPVDDFIPPQRDHSIGYMDVVSPFPNAVTPVMKIEATASYGKHAAWTHSPHSPNELCDCPNPNPGKPFHCAAKIVFDTTNGVES